MERARQCLKLFYEPDMPGRDRAGVLELFGRALRFTPKWAVSRAFDVWERDATHRPSPGNIVKLARDEVERLAAELKHRERLARQPEPEPERTVDEKARAEQVLRKAGFTPKRFSAVSRRRMARSEAELYRQDATAGRHWSEDLPPGHPTRKLFGVDLEDMA